MNHRKVQQSPTVDRFHQTDRWNEYGFIDSATRWTLAAAMWMTIALLIYASIVPLDFSPITFDAAIAKFQNTPWLNLQIERRADWVANALVVIPSAFFAMGAVDWGRPRRLAWMTMPATVFWLSAIVIAIEFLQLWFPTRTVSQNDIVAGIVGAVLGCCSWLIVGRWIVRSFETFCTLESMEQRIRWVLAALCAASIVYTLFPFDLVLTVDELRQKVAEGRLRWDFQVGRLASWEGLKGLVLAAGKILPFGLWFGLGRSKHFPGLGLALIAIGLEIVQVPIYSKYATEWELLLGILGGWLGWWIVSSRHDWLPWVRFAWIWNLASLGWMVVIFVAFNGRMKSILHDGELIRNRWSEFFTPPLLKYYFTSEYSALTNLAGKLGMFGALGMFWAVAGFVQTGHCSLRRFWIGAAASLFLGATIEIIQVYLPPMVADASDSAIYTIGYAMGYLLVFVLSCGIGRQRNKLLPRDALA